MDLLQVCIFYIPQYFLHYDPKFSYIFKMHKPRTCGLSMGSTRLCSPGYGFFFPSCSSFSRHLADFDHDNKLDIDQFLIAKFLLVSRERGFELPSALPAKLLQSINPSLVVDPKSSTPKSPISKGEKLLGRVDEAKLITLQKRMRTPQIGIPMKDRKSFLKTHRDCFQGSKFFSFVSIFQKENNSWTG